MGETRGQTFVKICGITRLGDARVAVRAGANALGFIFTRSPRRISASQASAIAPHIHPTVRKFGVFADATAAKIIEVVQRAGLDGVQLQGSEGPDLIDELKERLHSLFISRVVRATTESSITAVPQSGADAIFFDTRDTKQPLAESKLIPPQWLKGIDLEHVVIAGGLTPNNVGDLVREFRPWGVDVSSGVEESPGRKDPEKIRAFIREVRAAERVI